MKSIFFLFLYFSCFTLVAQQCDCVKDFLFVKSHMEKNHPGFNSDIKNPNSPSYKAFADSIQRLIEKDKRGVRCVAYIRKYLFYLKDHHINYYGSSTPVREDSAEAVNAFLQSQAYLKGELIYIDSLKIIELIKNSKDPTEGIYQTPDQTYTIAVLKDKTPDRDYAGIILNSKSKLWTRHQVKLELKRLNDSTAEQYSYLRNHSLDFQRIRVSKDVIELQGWNKISGASTVSGNRKKPMSTDLTSFVVLDAKTAMISIRSFGGQFNAKLDSFYKATLPELKKYPNWIIDVRGNGGGSDRNYMALMPFIYTDTIIGDVIELYATPDNISAYQEILDRYKNDPERYGKNGYVTWVTPLSIMKRAGSNSFAPYGSNGTPSKSAYKAEKGYPEKVAILYDRNCGSSCESLLFESMFSKKVIRVGENSGGYTGYGNVMDIKTPCGNTLSWTTMRYRNQRQYDFVGIAPNHKIPETETDWVEYTRQLINR